MKALKKHLVGFETELLLLEDNGAVSTRADELIDRASRARLKFPVHKDYTHNMIEISSIASVKVMKGAHGWLQTMQQLMSLSRESGLRLYPFGTYHGTHVPSARTDRYYRMCEDILGPARYTHATGHVSGFHLHYTLPYGTFNRKTRNLRKLFNSRYKEQLLAIYNSLIAIDPAISNFMESSPFIDGLHAAKDSRVFLYRSMRTARGEMAVRGLYRDLPLFGALPHYSSTLSDLILLVEERHSEWREMVEDRHPEYLDIVDSRHPLQFNWGPIRINRVGTFEYRGMDMNLPANMLGTSLLVKYFIKRIKREELHVKPSDIGIREPFKVEGGVLHVPPFNYLASVLQHKSALLGLEDDDVYNNARAMANFAMKEVPSRKDPGLERIKAILSSRKTKSDEILDFVRKAGYDASEKLDEEFARDLALKGCEELEAEVYRMLDAPLVIDLEE